MNKTNIFSAGISCALLCAAFIPAPAAAEFFVIPVKDKSAPICKAELPTPRFTDNNDGTVTDRHTGLVWLKKADCSGAGKNWESARTAARFLHDGWTGDGNGGDCSLADGSAFGEWRLPTVKELLSLIHYEYSSPALSNTAGNGQWSEGDAFTGVQPNYYWSSTSDPVNLASAWVVGLSSGSAEIYGKSNASPLVWPVRDAVTNRPNKEGNCADGIDNDGDAVIDCSDSDCVGNPECVVPENCVDSIDNDEDGATDCSDTECADDPACKVLEQCTDGIDNDKDGAVDCYDYADCSGKPGCIEQCGDGIDNDKDGQIDEGC